MLYGDEFWILACASRVKHVQGGTFFSEFRSLQNLCWGFDSEAFRRQFVSGFEVVLSVYLNGRVSFACSGLPKTVE